MANISKRIGYIDALRGFTMILVVFSHIYLDNTSLVNQFFINFRMPLFFFISGFISFRREQSWSTSDTLSRLGSKVRTMIIPAFVVGMIFTLIHGEVPITEFFTRPTKMGYWFTFALFNMLVIYYSARRLNARRGTALELFTKRLFTIAIICFFALSDLSALGYVDTTLTLSMTFKYFHYFAFGAMCSCRREWFERTLDNSAKMGIVVIGLFALSWWIIALNNNMDLATCYLAHKHVVIISALIRAIIGYFGILTVFGLFRRYSEFFGENRYIGKPLQFVGRNTLDIYLLHYFVLLNMPIVLRPYIADTSNIFTPLVVGLTVAVLVVAISLLISRIIRLSDHLAYYLLGARNITNIK